MLVWRDISRNMSSFFENAAVKVIEVHVRNTRWHAILPRIHITHFSIESFDKKKCIKKHVKIKIGNFILENIIVHKKCIWM